MVVIDYLPGTPEDRYAAAPAANDAAGESRLRHFLRDAAGLAAILAAAVALIALRAWIYFPASAHLHG